MKLIANSIIITLISFLLASCSSPAIFENKDSAPNKQVNLSHVKPITPKYEPKSRIGNPKSYQVFGKTYKVLPNSKDFTQTGIASWYGTKFHGRKTSNGDTYDMFELTAAHKSLPLPTYVEITNLENDKSLIVRVNDRGPFHDNRIIDLSHAAAAKLGVLAKGTAKVTIKAINLYDKNHKIPNDDFENTETIYAANNATENNQDQIIQAGAFGSIENALRFKNTIKDIFSSEKIDPRIITVKNINNLYKVYIENVSTNYQKITNLLSMNEINYSVLTK